MVIVFYTSFAFSCSSFQTLDAHGHDTGGSHAAHGPEGDLVTEKQVPRSGDLEAMNHLKDVADSASAQIIGIAILEFGVVLHRYVS
jgi:zinc transporter 1/2/3